MWTTTAALAATAGIAAAALAGCSADEGADCRPAASAVVTAAGPDGRSWTARTSATEDPPSIGGGYVLVRHSCGWTALDLDDGSVVREGDGDAVGVAGGLVYTRDEDGESVTGEPVAEGDPPDGHGGMTVTSPGADLRAHTVDDRLYVFSADDGPVNLSQYAGAGDRRWDTVLTVLRSPTFTPVGQTLVVTSTDGSVYGLDATAGTVRWRVLAPTVASTSLLRYAPATTTRW